MPDPAPDRDPRQVRFWGWVTLVAMIVIATVYLLIDHPWTRS